MDRWVLAIVGTFAVVFLANGVMLFAALNNPVSIEASYEEEAR
jgi:hypothetical protein